jgi:single-strand DNA-binding protein
MTEGLNKAILIGNLGQDPELRYTQGGQAVLNLRLATTETFFNRDKERQQRTEWHTVVVWGKRGEALNKILSKGRSICVEGRIQTRRWEDRDGNKRYGTEIVATNVILIGGRGAAGQASDYAGGYSSQPYGSEEGGDFPIPNTGEGEHEPPFDNGDDIPF